MTSCLSHSVMLAFHRDCRGIYSNSKGPDVRLLFILTVALMLGACATPYQENTALAYTGGYSDAPGPGHLEYVVFNGNGFVKPSTIQKYTLYRCAELAKLKHKAYFAIYSNLTEAALETPSAMPMIGSVGKKPVGSAYVLFLDKHIPGAKKTTKVLTTLKPFIEKSH